VFVSSYGDASPQKHSGNIQGTFRKHSGNIEEAFREISRKIQGTLREHSRNIQRFDYQQAKVQWRLSKCTTSILRRRKLQVQGSIGTQGTYGKRSGNMQRTYREHSENVQGTCRERTENILRTFREHAENVQRTYGKRSGNMQRTYREHSENVQGTFGDSTTSKPRSGGGYQSAPRAYCGGEGFRFVGQLVFVGGDELRDDGLHQELQPAAGHLIQGTFEEDSGNI
jgi:hypothetical protein